MNIIQIFFEKLADNCCNNLLITITIIFSISVTSCFITYLIIRYLKFKRKHDDEIEMQILMKNQFDSLDQRLGLVENELQNIKATLTKQNTLNKRKCFFYRLWRKICG